MASQGQGLRAWLDESNPRQPAERNNLALLAVFATIFVAPKPPDKSDITAKSLRGRQTVFAISKGLYARIKRCTQPGLSTLKLKA